MTEQRGELPAYQMWELGENALLIWFAGGRPGARIPFLTILAVILRASLVPKPTDVVPAATSVLLIFEPSAYDIGLVKERLTQLIANAINQALPPGGEHTVPVHYGEEDGPDLSAVARRHRVSESAIVRAHAASDYLVGFLGFLPGFAYMGPTQLGIATSRLASPRVRVPAGSVGLAGRYTGVYPFASPGGWNLIGRTELPIWNPYEPTPARFSPGDRVRFVQTSAPPLEVSTESPIFESRYPLFEVESPGILTLVQSTGRHGYAHLGLSEGGCSDSFAAGRANALVGNDPGAGLLEIAWNGPTLKVLASTVIALEGADLGCRVDGLAVPTGCGWFVRAGSLICFAQSSPSQTGARAFLAVAGGLDVSLVLGSRSTCLVAGFGGHGGRALRAGDVLGTNQEPSQGNLLAGKYWLPRVESRIRGTAILRIIPYAGQGSAGKRALSGLVDRQWTVTTAADRVGIRLTPRNGDSLAGRRRSVPSFGVVRGTVQLPPDGNPLLLGVDSGTTGGYPVIGVVAKSDDVITAQLRPGDVVSFEVTTVETAREAYRADVAALRAGTLRLNFRTA